MLQAGHDSEQGRFAAAGRPDQRQRMHLLKLERHAVQRHVGAESLGDLLQAQFHGQVSKLCRFSRRRVQSEIGSVKMRYPAASGR